MGTQYTIVETELLEDARWRGLSHLEARVGLAVLCRAKAVARVGLLEAGGLPPIAFAARDCGFRIGRNSLARALCALEAAGFLRVARSPGRAAVVTWRWAPGGDPGAPAPAPNGAPMPPAETALDPPAGGLDQGMELFAWPSPPPPAPRPPHLDAGQAVSPAPAHAPRAPAPGGGAPHAVPGPDPRPEVAAPPPPGAPSNSQTKNKTPIGLDSADILSEPSGDLANTIAAATSSAFLNGLWVRLRPFTPTGPWRRWWKEAIGASRALPAVPAALDEALRRVEDAANPRIRRAKDVGPFTDPHRFLVKRMTQAMRAAGLRWPPFPAAPVAHAGR